MPSRPSFNIGIEEEYQIIDPMTRELRSYISLFRESNDKVILREREMAPHMQQTLVEVSTRVCPNISAARDELLRQRMGIMTLAERRNLKIAAAGTHPFSYAQAEEIIPFERYRDRTTDLTSILRSTLIFGMHVHIGIEDRELAIDTMNVVRYMLPHLLCLSTSSPFWLGHNTGLKSYRAVLFEDFPRTGLPDYFGSYGEYENFVQMLLQTHCIDNPRQIWWDIRPHANYPTLEFRILDMCTTIDEAACLAALCQALCAKLYYLRRQNRTFRIYRVELVEENKWRAERYGLDGNMIDFGREQEMPARVLLGELLDFVEDVVDELGSRREVEYARQIIANGTSADRQLAVYERAGNLNAVVDHLIAETAMGL